MSVYVGGATEAPVRRPVVGAPADRRFFTGMAVAIALIVFAGFAPTFYLRPAFHPAPLSRVFVIHGLVFTAWIVLFVVQTSLVSARRTHIHRKLGVLGGVLAVLMLVVGYLAAVTATRRGFSAPGLPPALVFFAVPFFDLVAFASLVGSGLYFRRSPAAHKRLMLLSTTAILTAAIARLPHVLPLGPLVFFGLTDLFVVALMLYDRITLGRVHPATLWGGLFLVASQALRLVVSGTAAWLAFAHWLTGV
jgi:hypothetical protein